MGLIFEAKSGVFGEYGWKRISFWKWLIMFPDYVTRSRARRQNGSNVRKNNRSTSSNERQRS